MDISKGVAVTNDNNISVTSFSEGLITEVFPGPRSFFTAATYISSTKTYLVWPHCLLKEMVMLLF